MLIKVILPLSIGKKTTSLNWYRNAYFRELNEIKKKASLLVQAQLENPPVKPFLSCVQTVNFYPDNLAKDLKNFCAVACKFADDAIVKSGFLKDDSCKYFKKSTEQFIEIDKENPRIEIIYELS